MVQIKNKENGNITDYSLKETSTCKCWTWFHLGKWRISPSEILCDKGFTINFYFSLQFSLHIKIKQFSSVRSLDKKATFKKYLVFPSTIIFWNYGANKKTRRMGTLLITLSKKQAHVSVELDFTWGNEEYIQVKYYVINLSLLTSILRFS